MTEPQEAVWPLPDDLAYVGVDGHIYILHADGHTPLRVTWNAKGLSYGVWRSDESIDRIRYFWPTWSPVGDKIACLGTYGQNGQEIGTGVYALDLVTGVESWEVWAGMESAPIYLNWSPGGERLAFILQRNDALSLMVANLNEPGECTTLLSGIPLFHGFSPDGASLAIHLGGRFNGQPGRRLYLVDLESPEQRLTLSNRPGMFGTPCWSPDGCYLAFTVEEEEQQEICLSECALGQPRRLGKFPGIGAMLWSASGQDILVGTAPLDAEGSFQQLWSFPLDGREPDVLLEEAFITYDCTRDGRIIFLQAEEQDLSLTWKAREPDGSIRSLGTFFPSQPQMFLNHFFHQYRQSHRQISCDDTRLVFSGYKTRKEMEDDYTLPRIFILNMNEDGPPVPVADGSIACWSPSVRRNVS